MAFGAERTVRMVAAHARTEDNTQHAAHLIVQLFGGDLTLEDEFLIGVGQIVIVVGIAGACRQAVGP